MIYINAAEQIFGEESAFNLISKFDYKCTLGGKIYKIDIN